MELSKSLVSRFKRKLGKPTLTGCIPWLGAATKKGYGLLKLGAPSRSNILAHRVAWIVANGDIQDDLLVCHHCDNPSCVNPEHLFTGTHRDNLLDMVAKDRHSKVKARGDANGQNTHPEKRPRGESNGSSKLTNQTISEIRQKFYDGESSTRLARDYKVTRQTIWRITTRRSWNPPLKRIRQPKPTKRKG